MNHKFGSFQNDPSIDLKYINVRLLNEPQLNQLKIVTTSIVKTLHYFLSLKVIN